MDDLSFETIAALGDDMTAWIDPLIWTRGFNYFLLDHVETYSYDGDAVYASVRGDQDRAYVLRMDLNDFAEGSICSCPYDHHCKHMVAVFFELYAEYDDPLAFLNTVTVGENFTGMQSSRSRVSIPAPTPDQTLTEWAAYCQHLFDEIAMRIPRQGYAMDSKRDIVDRLLSVAVAWPEQARYFYELFVMAFLIRQADRLMGNSYDYSYYARPISHRLQQICLSEIPNKARALDGIDESWTEVGDGLDRLLAYLRETLVEDQSTDGPVLAYQEMWLTLKQAAESRVVDELGRLQTLSEERPEDSHKKATTSLDSARLLLLVMANHDADAEQLALTLKTPVATLRACFRHLVQVGAFDRLQRWFQWLDDHSQHVDPQGHGWFAQDWMQAALAHEVFIPGALTYMRSHIEYTRHTYEKLLLSLGRYRSWVELQMLDDGFPTHARREDLSLVEKADRATLLPWYHQGIERAIRVKNRDGYKLAARLMKKLQGHYKKLKRLGDFEAYVSDILGRYSRLRALREEMEKKGLIS